MPRADRIEVTVIDSHTAGEPTRTVLAGGPDLGNGPIPERLARFRNQHDAYRSAIVNEPRGSDVLVGALVLPPHQSDHHCAVIFFNNVGYLGMCGHGLIGVVATLADLGTLQPGRHAIETPVGVVQATLHQDGAVTIANVPSHREAHHVSVDVPGLGSLTGDVAWGGNWFFLTSLPTPALRLENQEQLIDMCWRIRQAVNNQGWPLIDHIELTGPAVGPDAHARNFVLCPGKAYDRSPCGTGTSAKLACLAAEGRLEPGQRWVQEGILGTSFEASYQRRGNQILPEITGRAHVTARSTLILDPDDPYRFGIRP